MNTNFPSGYVCTCGHKNKYSFYVYAHAREKLSHKCRACQRPYVILNLFAQAVTKGKGEKCKPVAEHFYKCSD